MWYQARLLLNVSLFCALLAMCSPYGPRDWRYSYGSYHSVFQTILSILAFLALVGVALDTVAPKLSRTHTGWPYMLATFALTAQATYVVFEPGILILARVSQLLIYFSSAVIAAGGWYLRKMNVRLGYPDDPLIGHAESSSYAQTRPATTGSSSESRRRAGPGRTPPR